MPVAEDILETNPTGQSLVEWPDRDRADLADEVGVVDGIGLVTRNDAGDAAACRPDHGNAAGAGRNAATETGTVLPIVCAIAWSKKPSIENTPSTSTIRIRSGSRPALIQRNRPPKALGLSASIPRSWPTSSPIERPTSIDISFDAAECHHDCGGNREWPDVWREQDVVEGTHC